MVSRYEHPEGEAKKEYVRELFDRIAPDYQEMNRLMSAGQWTRWQRAFAKYADLKPGSVCLDVACGTADLSLVVAKEVSPGGKVIGIDFSPGMLEVGRRRVAESPYRDMVTLKWGDALDLPFEDNTFDVVTMGWAMRNVSAISEVLAEVYRVLKPGGKFLSMDASKPYSKLVRLGFMLYFKTMPPLLDKLLPDTKEYKEIRPYTYLSHSLDDFPFANELEDMFRAAGFRETEYKLLMMGGVAIHSGIK